MDYDPMSPIWLQVVNRIKGSIATGAIGPGEKLPGGRDLAVRFSINPNTAARVYQELEKEAEEVKAEKKAPAKKPAAKKAAPKAEDAEEAPAKKPRAPRKKKAE